MKPHLADASMPPDFLAEAGTRKKSFMTRHLVCRVAAIGDWTLGFLDAAEPEQKEAMLIEALARAEYLVDRLRELAGEEKPPVPESCALCPWLTISLPLEADGKWCGRMLTEGVSEVEAQVPESGTPPAKCPRR